MNRLLTFVKSKADAGSVVAKRDYALLLLYFLTGLRRTELISLRGTDVELKEKGLILKYRRKGVLTLRSTTAHVRANRPRLMARREPGSRL
jgi:integrase